MTGQHNWKDFCQRAATVMRRALEKKTTLKEASDFFDNDMTITNSDLCRYVESMIWEIDSSRDYFMAFLQLFESEATEEDFVKYLNS